MGFATTVTSSFAVRGTLRMGWAGAVAPFAPFAPLARAGAAARVPRTGP